jgi:phosphoribosylformylglycinamidine synthase
VLVGAEFVHFAHCADQLTQDETTTLETLLNYDQTVDLNTKAQIIVMPRLGTISPWSSKASDILHLCGLEKIKRIERGIIYHFDRSVTDKKAVLSVIMDKMTESELCSIDEAHSIFDDFEPRPFVHGPAKTSGVGHITIK